ncbi:thermonuclease family protein [Paradevosia shaoguanensis]|uniref:thermonuclease family protein n=1 Tax=Paradevosia shaoguanensis TaxID=1335043 RepID=UPI003C77F41C
MSVIHLRRRPPKARHREVPTSVYAAAAVVSVCALGYVVADQNLPGGGEIARLMTTPVASLGERRVHFEMCGRDRHTCIVDGDTIWLDGKNLRLESYDTPEPYTAICGGAAEQALARRASARFRELLNSNPFTVTTGGLDNTGKRTLATIRIGGRDVGDILIEEGLARRWPDGDEWWCN